MRSDENWSRNEMLYRLLIHSSNKKLVVGLQYFMGWKCGCSVASWFFKSWLSRAKWLFLTLFDISRSRNGSNFALLLNSSVTQTNPYDKLAFNWDCCLFSRILFNTFWAKCHIQNRSYYFETPWLLQWIELFSKLLLHFEMISIIFIIPIKNLQERVKSENEC